ncbi:MAG: hypothetical protein EOM19_02160 [Candidatus Moranbacteria bacterium]|nr:hypothetical protein [Candidatus Moranbacteria bacterium]
MKIVNIGNNLINLDKVVYLDIQRGTLFLESNKEIHMSEAEIEQFVFDYNMYDTDETKTLLERLTRVVTSNPEYLTKEGIQEQITIKVRYHKLEDYFKEISEGQKLKEMSLAKLLMVFKLIQEKVKEIEDEKPF